MQHNGTAALKLPSTPPPLGRLPKGALPLPMLRIWLQGELAACGASRCTRRVLHGLLEYANSAGVAWCAVEDLATRASCCERTVQRCLFWARSLGIVTLARRGGLGRVGGVGYANVWRFGTKARGSLGQRTRARWQSLLRALTFRVGRKMSPQGKTSIEGRAATVRPSCRPRPHATPAARAPPSPGRLAWLEAGQRMFGRSREEVGQGR